MKKALIVVTGVKFSPLKKEFNGGQIVNYIDHKGKKYKMNAGAGVVRQLIDDYEIIACGYSQSDAQILESEFGLSKQTTGRRVCQTSRQPQAVARTTSPSCPLWWRFRYSDTSTK